MTLSSARVMLARANKDFIKLERATGRAIKNQAYEMFSEPHPEKPEFFICKMRLASELPDAISELTGHIVNNLRFSLDHALSEIAVSSGCTKPRHLRNAYFPFSGNQPTFESNLAGRCADVPQTMWPLLRKYRPYKGGEDLLFALNETCTAHKHDLVTPVGTITLTSGVEIGATGFFSMPYPRPVWDSAKKEMELFTMHSSGTTNLKCNLQFSTFITFGDVGMASGQPLVPTLKRFIGMVEIILREIEEEATRLGLLK
jgi:hypothetical protein